MNQNGTGLLVVASVLLGIWILSVLTASVRERQLEKRGILPPLRQTTDEDIIRLAKSGYRVWAIRRYRQLHGVSLKEARDAVDARMK
ncbi:hypothetical protein AAIA72_11680 [Hahella sp. SMD15-11]|uniref:Ribosomal protein L7/L12 C-terminal domain-containing protein n=1 Tax=Thermohahella caldifontis TaxID=3142973 RepID=A0AB39UTU5_9GAMM